MHALAATRTALVFLPLAVFAAASAGGQTVYRCGPAGNQYSAQPCENGRAVDVSDRRSAEQLAEARNGVAAQRRLAVAMAREREAMERARSPAQAGVIGPMPAPASRPGSVASPRPASRKPPAKAIKPSDDGRDFVAVVPGSRKAVKKTAQP